MFLFTRLLRHEQEVTYDQFKADLNSQLFFF